MFVAIPWHIPWFNTVQQSTLWFTVAIVVSCILFVALMAVLHRLPPQGKKWLMIVSTFLAGLYFLFDFFIPPPAGQSQNFIDKTVPDTSSFVNYIWMWAVLIGMISLVMVHGRKIVKREAGWHHSIAFFLSMIAIIVFGFWSRLGDWTQAPFIITRTYNSLFAGLLINLDAAMFSLLAFYIASAAYRAFRVRTVEAALLMVSALIVMLGFINFGVMLTSWIPIDSWWNGLRFERLATWMLMWVNMPAQRAVGIGVAVGGLAMAMRLWLSLERGSFFSQE